MRFATLKNTTADNSTLQLVAVLGSQSKDAVYAAYPWMTD